jgi:hypothetical protein
MGNRVFVVRAGELAFTSRASRSCLWLPDALPAMLTLPRPYTAMSWKPTRGEDTCFVAHRSHIVLRHGILKFPITIASCGDPPPTSSHKQNHAQNVWSSGCRRKHVG